MELGDRTVSTCSRWLALAEAAATQSVLAANAIAVAVAGILVLPSLWWLYITFQRDQFPRTDEPSELQKDEPRQ
ncbi:hypothetical protein [Arthrobacter sp. D1-17]